jgi:2-keto-4-pentenoate hydratase
VRRMAEDLSDRGRPIYGPTPPGQGAPCSRQSPLTGAEVAEVAAVSAAARGSETRSWRDLDLPGAGMDASLNGRYVKSGQGRAAMDHPVTSLTWMLNWAGRTTGRSGPTTSSARAPAPGTCTGHLFAAPGDTVRADFGPLGVVEAHFA